MLYPILCALQVVSFIRLLFWQASLRIHGRRKASFPAGEDEMIASKKQG